MGKEIPMEASYHYTVTAPHFCASLSTAKPKFSSIASEQIHPQQLSFSHYNPRLRPPNRGSLAASIGCAKRGPVREVEREFEEEMKSISGEDGLIVGEKWRGRCEGGEGIVELMECLEMEAIMGDDEGREPTDYNRRALIFDKSSRVFQALKEKDAHKS